MDPVIVYIQERRDAFVEELKAFCRIPSVSTKSATRSWGGRPTLAVR